MRRREAIFLISPIYFVSHPWREIHCLFCFVTMANDDSGLSPCPPSSTTLPIVQSNNVATLSPGHPFAPPIGTRIQVLWRIVYDEKDDAAEQVNATDPQTDDSNVDERWWGAVVQDCTNETVGSRSPEHAHLKVHILLYDAYNDFPEETARVAFLPGNVLLELSMLGEADSGRLDWQLESDSTMEDDPSSAVCSAEFLAREADEIVQQSGLSVDADLHALATMPHNVQLHVASGYRNFADAVKRLLGELIATKPTDYVVTADDVRDIMSRVRSQGRQQKAETLAGAAL